MRLNNISFFRYLLCFLPLIFSLQCRSPSDINKDAFDVPSFVVVLCDVSTSISSRAGEDRKQYLEMIAKLKDNCSKLVRTYPPGSHIEFYTISENSSSHPFATFELKELYKNKAVGEKRTLYAKVQEMNSMLDSAATNHENNTCILTSLQTAYNTIEKNADQPNAKKYKNELVIFSDLLEQCKSSPVGPINMQKSSVLLSASEFKQLRNLSTNINFARYNIDVKIYLTAHKTISPQEPALDSTWRMIFSKFGYQCNKNAHVLWAIEPNFIIREEYKVFPPR